MSEELIKKCTSEAIKALSPLLDNEETKFAEDGKSLSC